MTTWTSDELTKVDAARDERRESQTGRYLRNTLRSAKIWC